MKNRFQSANRHSLSAQEIYFTEPKATQHNLGMTLLCTGLLMTTLSACFLPVVSRAATSELASATRTTEPATQRRVFQQGLPTYHWHFNCPLAAGNSHRAPKTDAAEKRHYMTKTQAEEKSLMACSFCLDME